MPGSRKTQRTEEEAPNKKQRTLTAGQVAHQEEKTATIKNAREQIAVQKAARREAKRQQPPQATAAEEGDDADSWATVSSDSDDGEVDEPFDDDYEEIIEESEEEAMMDEEEEEEGEGDEAVGAAVSGTRGTQIGDLKNVRFADDAAKVLQEDDEGEANGATVWRGGELKEGQNLEYSNQAYDSFFQLRSEWPCLSFDIVRDQDGEGRTKYPLSMTFVAGTQADQSGKNELVVLRVSNICKTKYDLADDESEDSMMGDEERSDDEGETGEEINNGEPIVDSKSIPHHGAVNRLRCDPNKPHQVAAWSDAGHVQVFDIESEVRSMTDFAAWSQEQAANWNKTKGTALRFTSSSSTHKEEGYGLDWSALQKHTFASGDCAGGLFVWKPTTDGRWTPFATSRAVASIEEIKWSSIQPNVLVTACAGGSMHVWDERDMRRPKGSWQADESDINVFDWNKATSSSHLLVTGAEEGNVAIWDLRKVQKATAERTAAQPIQLLTYHQGVKVTSVEFSQHNEMVVAVCADDGQCTLWDLSLERDADEERQVLGDLFGRADVSNLPDQLMFQHQGLQHPKECHFHRQIPGMVVTTDYNGFHLFKPMNWRSLMK